MLYAANVERNTTEPIIVCPLAFERDALRRGGVRGRLICIGPGEAGIERLAGIVRDQPPRPVILAGVAGALDGTCPAGSACIVSEVISGEGTRWRPSWRGSANQPVATVASSRDVLMTAYMKRTFAMRIGAQLVDQESEPFAQLATDRGWNWGIVRGVSDDPSTSLPPDIHKWITNDGQTRIVRALLSCIAQPQRIGTLITLQRNSARAMAAVAEILCAET